MQMNSIARFMGLCMLLVLASCSSNVNQPEHIGPQFAQNTKTCPRYEVRTFDLLEVWDASHDFRYELDVTTHPYTLRNCVCEVQYYWLEDTEFPEGLIITNDQDEEINYHRTNTESGDERLIIYPEELTEETVTIFVDYPDTPPAAAPGGSGLCIIDNLGGGDYPVYNMRIGDQGFHLDSIFTTPAQISWTNQILNLVDKKTFVPETFTN